MIRNGSPYVLATRWGGGDGAVPVAGYQKVNPPKWR